jgi:hypothetical protein
MSFVISAGATRDFQPHPAGAYPARCTRIIDLGTQETTFQGEVKHVRQVMLSFESSELMTEGEKAGQPFIVAQTFTASLGEKAKLRKYLEGWRGRKFTKAEAEGGWDLKSVLGKPALLQIVHSEGERVYANIQTIMQLPSGMTAPPAVGELLSLSLASFDQSVYDKLGDKLKERIAKSPEFQQVMAGKRPSSTKKAATAAPTTEDDLLDQDIPF